MQQLSWSLSRFETQDIKTQPKFNHYVPDPFFSSTKSRYIMVDSLGVVCCLERPAFLSLPLLRVAHTFWLGNSIREEEQKPPLSRLPFYNRDTGPLWCLKFMTDESSWMVVWRIKLQPSPRLNSSYNFQVIRLQAAIRAQTTGPILELLWNDWYTPSTTSPQLHLTTPTDSSCRKGKRCQSGLWMSGWGVLVVWGGPCGKESDIHPSFQALKDEEHACYGCRFLFQKTSSGFKGETRPLMLGG